MASDKSSSHKGRNAGIASVVIVVVIIIAGLLIYIPVSTATGIPYTSTSTNYAPIPTTFGVPYTSTSTNHVPTNVPVLVVSQVTITYITSSTSTETIIEQSTTSSQVWDIASATIGCNPYPQAQAYTYASAQLQTSWTVAVSYSASDTVNVYVFDSTQYSAFVSSGTTSPNIYGQGNAPASGTFGITASLSDTYYLVFTNPHNGVDCLGSHNVGIYSGIGTATHTVPVTNTIYQINQYETSSQTVTTQTSTSTSTSTQFIPVTLTSTTTSTSLNTQFIPVTLTSTTTNTCSFAFWNWLFSSKTCS